MATRDKKLELLALLEEKRRRDDVYRYKQFGEKLYPIQRELLQRTASHTQVCCMASIYVPVIVLPTRFAAIKQT